ncbi:hypothetical protein MMYC01_204676 [Madurella mycetomatis]|uniref:Uncharacterized protein n=1 Tax=Madurella mycetomatis TaxID=100816 RepID=A0A175W9D8_9PEZI|nr:hypothetical protein MMYC01_204676 [Madurella mycetomatis]
MPSNRRLPRRQEDPFRRINDWDDGYDYLKTSNAASPSGRRAQSPMYKPPPPAPVPPREAWEWAEEQKPPRWDARRARYPSPPSDSDGYSRQRRQPRASSPAGGYRGSGRGRSPSPLRRQQDQPRHRPPLEPRATAPMPRTRGFRDTPPPMSGPSSRPSRTRSSPSPSPIRHRDPDSDRDRDRGRDRDWDRVRRRASPRRHRYRSPTPPPPRSFRRHRSPSPARAKATRPPITRSKTTSADNRSPQTDRAKKDRLSLANLGHLSPRWQKAATAAIQAGGLAALSARSQPGAWKGEKGARVATAALGAVARDVLSGDSGDDGGRRERDRGRGGRGSGGSSRSRGLGGGGNVEALGDAFGDFIADRLARSRSRRK